MNKFLSEFLITVRKKSEEYEPNSLRAFFTSFEHHLKKKKTVDPIKDVHAVRPISETSSAKAKGSKTVCSSSF